MKFLARNGASHGVRRLIGAVAARQHRKNPPNGLRIADWPADEQLPDQSSIAQLPLRMRSASADSLSAITLATREWMLVDGEPWDGRFDDPEDSLAAHRFAWIPRVLANRGPRAVNELLAIASRWIMRYRTATGGPGWDSYSVAERTAHFSYLASALSASASATALLTVIGEHAVFLRSHLEFRGPATNNHLINDGRALYLASVVTGDGRFRAMARELLTFAAERMFVNGFLREGSSHYHFLLTRTYLEVLTAARTCGDYDFAEELTTSSREMVEASRFLADSSGSSMVGDLCPDFPPAFLIPFATASGTEGWGALLEIPVNPEERDAVDPGKNYSEAGFFKTSFGGWRVFAWVNPAGHVPAWSHAHADLGSFVADWHGRPFLTDAGRATYADTPLGRYGRSVRSHNSIAIDGHEPCIVHGLNGIPELMSEAYLNSRPVAGVTQDGCGTTLRICHAGFARLGDGLEVVRTVALSTDRLVVHDELRGVGRHTVETFFQFAPDVEIARDGPTNWRCTLTAAPTLRFSGPPPVDHVRAASGSQPLGWQSSAYGQTVPASTFVFRYEGPFPAAREYVMQRI